MSAYELTNTYMSNIYSQSIARCEQIQYINDTDAIQELIDTINLLYFTCNSSEEFIKKYEEYDISGCIKKIGSGCVYTKTMDDIEDIPCIEKYNKYHSIAHYSSNLKYILNIGVTIPYAVIEILRNEVGDKKYTKNVIKDKLKKLKLTKYTKYMSTLMKILYKCDIPTFTTCEIDNILKHCTFVITLIDKYINKNTLYTPFFIDRVIQNIYPDRSVSHLILQKSEKTHKKLVNIWNNICEEIGMKRI